MKQCFSKNVIFFHISLVLHSRNYQLVNVFFVCLFVLFYIVKWEVIAWQGAGLCVRDDGRIFICLVLVCSYGYFQIWNCNSVQLTDIDYTFYVTSTFLVVFLKPEIQIVRIKIYYFCIMFIFTFHISQVLQFLFVSSVKWE